MKGCHETSHCLLIIASILHFCTPQAELHITPSDSWTSEPRWCKFTPIFSWRINRSRSIPDLPNAKSYPLDHPRDLVLNPPLPPPPTHELGMKMKIVVSDFLWLFLRFYQLLRLNENENNYWKNENENGKKYKNKNEGALSIFRSSSRNIVFLWYSIIFYWYKYHIM